MIFVMYVGGVGNFKVEFGMEMGDCDDEDFFFYLCIERLLN